ncbi:EF hand protein, putative (macronuclear) [Tetrahymena thermophila SB210]|uniref:EF hand protein, putative n=1 Tax=Tetrahymena thermophila (strain SB210) TaxID=312017 RepID=C0NA18_TETTS|nr:EF hand protein, putative [Tetrahymena thermophila SB210]EEH11761.1 EF hand protein, putative [Tetrahymena thermophila SB210]|eukprot:XP_002348339.1 EF hand protein, putative [Tetrahymena thermophila SB210]
MSGQDSNYTTGQQPYQQGIKSYTLNLAQKNISELNSFLPPPEQAYSITTLILKDNKLKKLPEDLSRFKNLQIIDLTNNPIMIEAIIPGLQSLQNLSEVYINATPEQENFLKQNLGNHVSINGDNHDEPHQDYQENHYQENEEEHINYVRDPMRQNSSQTQSKEITLGKEDLVTLAQTFDQIRELYRQNNPSIDQRLAQSFDQHVKSVMEDLSTKIEQKSNEHITNTHIIKAKYALYEICFAKLIDYVANADSNIADVLQKIHDAHAIFVSEMSSIIEKLDEIKFNRPYAPDYQYLKNENEQLKQQVQSLTDENKHYLEIIVKHSKGQSTDVNTNKLESQGGQQRAFSPQFNPQKTKEMRKIQSTINQSVQSVGGPSTVRTLTIRQLKEVIEEIYKSKQTFDKKYQEAQLPRETMEQHMYTYLNQKYGLKNLIMEWAAAIINGIRNFVSDDNDIAVFGKILKNECDEEFRFVQNQVKNTIQELLKMYLRGRYPYKHNSEIKQMVSQKIEGWVYLEEASDIIKYMYNEEDSETLIEKVKFYIDQNRSNTNLPSDNLSTKKVTREQLLAMQQEKEKFKIEYVIFQKIILDFQLKSHEKFLKKFILLFRSVDKDLNGVIDEEQFKELIDKMDVKKDDTEIQRYLSILDPFNKQQITFSQCVTLFSSEVIETNDGQRLSILQKIQQFEFQNHKN